jgi:IS5 family transposase
MMKHKPGRGLYDEEFRLEKLAKQNDPLIKLDACINWGTFQVLIDQELAVEKNGPGGRPPYDNTLMFKMLILQRYYNMSDDQCEYQVLDRLSFSRFLGLTLSDRVPDAKTIWHFREKLIKGGTVEKLFALFNESLNSLGLIANEGKIIDASFVEAPRQRNSRAENAQVKNGEVPESWKAAPHKLAQKDTEAKWTKKNNETFYGYKNHVKTDQKSKLIDVYVVTDASVHDSQSVMELLEETDTEQELYADSAYRGKETEEALEFLGIVSRVHEKGTKGSPLSEEQNKSNREKSTVRARVEHIFGFVENSMNGSTLKSIGIKRATGIIGLMNLTYNMFRSIQIAKLQGKSLCV